MRAEEEQTGNNASEKFEEFTRESSRGRTGLASEFWEFLKHNKKWWLLPILIAMVGVGVLIVLGSSGAAPFIYPLF